MKFLEEHASKLQETIKQLRAHNNRLEEEVSKQVTAYRNQVEMTEDTQKGKDDFEKKLNKADIEIKRIQMLESEIEDWKARHKKAKKNFNEIDKQLKVELLNIEEKDKELEGLREEVAGLQAELGGNKEQLNKEK